VRKVVVLGAGHWRLPLYRDALLSEHTVTGVWDTEPGAARRAAAHLGTTAYPSVTECLSAEPDLAYVLGVHAQMPGICHQLIAARIPFALEVPGAAAVADLAEVCDEAEAADVPATAALIHRLGPLPALIGRLGELTHLRFSLLDGAPDRYVRAGCGWVLSRSASGGGCLYLAGVHFCDLLRVVTGEEIITSRSIRRYPAESDTEDYGVLTMQTSGGTIAVVEAGWTFTDGPSGRYVNYAATGTAGHLAVDTTGEAGVTSPHGRVRPEKVNVDTDGLYPEFVRAVAASYDAGFAGLPGLADLVEAIRPIEESYQTC
jgi:predicted dehydrogenase